MSSPSLDRRAFLKLTAFATLAGVTGRLTGLPEFFIQNTSALPNILVLVFDAMSARNMALYGYPRQNTPNLERFARRATVFHQHHAAGNFTSPGVSSLLTGVYPWEHQAVQQGSRVAPAFKDRSIFSLLPQQYQSFAYTHNRYVYILLDQFRQHIDKLPLIAELADYSGMYSEDLFPADYYLADKAEMTLKLQKNIKVPASLWLSLLDYWLTRLGNRSLASKLRSSYPYGPVSCGQGFVWGHCFQLEKAIDWTLEQALTSAAPYFGYVHYFPPHQPYTPRAEFAELFIDDHYQPPDKPIYPDGKPADQAAIDRQRLLYDQFIAHVDAEFGRLYDSLERSGVLENTCLVITSDHGEIFERGLIGHGTSAMYEPLLHIPLLIATPGQQERRDIYTPTSAVDLLPSILGLIGAGMPAGIDGLALPLDGIPEPAKPRPVFALEAKASPRGSSPHPSTSVVIDWPYKLISYRGYASMPDTPELYHLEQDPEELVDLYTPGNPIAEDLLRRLP
ncbi:MAG: sulfatase [Chloroflexota bacterium]